MMQLRIGDDRPFKLRRVRNEETGELWPDATITYELRHAVTNVLVAAGSVNLEDEDTATYGAVIPKAELTSDDLRAGDRYALDAIIVRNGVQSSLSVELLAVKRRYAT